MLTKYFETPVTAQSQNTACLGRYLATDDDGQERTRTDARGSVSALAELRQNKTTPLFLKRERGRGGKRKTSFLVKRSFPLSPTLSPFTLIELLVVIAIIAILAAMLMPALQQARERGKQSSCQSNLKQVVMAFVLYGDSFRSWIPSYSTATLYGLDGDLANSRPWIMLLARNTRLFDYSDRWARSGERPEQKGARFCPSVVKNALTPTSYGINMGLGYNTTTSSKPAAIRGRRYWGGLTVTGGITVFAKTDTMPSPGRVAAAGDGSSGYQIKPNKESSKVPGLVSGAELRHSGKLNMGFVDGHVELLAADQLQYWPSGDTRIRLQKPWY